MLPTSCTLQTEVFCNMSQITTHPTDKLSKNKNGEKRKKVFTDVENIEPAECVPSISERKKLKKKRKEAKLKLNEQQQESQTTREDDNCSSNDTPNKRQKGGKERHEGADNQDLNDDHGCKQPPACNAPEDCLVCQRKEKKKKSKTIQEFNDVNMEPVEGDKPRSQTSDGGLMLDTPVSKKRKVEKRKEKKKNTEPGNASNSENLQQSECEEPSLALDTPRIKKRKKRKMNDSKKNIENKDDQDVIIDEEPSTDLPKSQINVEGSAPKPDLMLDTPRKKKRKKDKGKLNDENTEPVEGDKPQAQISDGGSTPPIGLMLDMPTSKKKDNKLNEKKKNTENGNTLNSEDLQQSQCEEPSLTLGTPLIKKRKKDKRSKDSQKNEEKKDSQDVDEEQTTDLSSANVGVTSDTLSQKRKDKKVEDKSEIHKNQNDENLEHLPSQTRDVSPPPVDTAMLHTPTRKKKKKERKEKCENKNQELNDDLESTEREAPAGETSDVTLMKKRKRDKTSKKKKTKTDKTSKEKKSISWSDFFSVHEIPLAKQSGPRKRWMVCEGFQIILKHQAEALLKLGVNPHFKDVLCQLWRMYLQTSRQAYTNNPIRHSHLKRAMRSQSSDVGMDSSFLSSEDDRRSDMFSDTGDTSGEETEDSECESVISGSFDAAKYLTKSRKRAGSLLSMRKTLALCYLALVWCREGMTLSELLRFVSEGHIPYVNAHDLFPEDMKPTGRDTLFFRMTSIPLYKDVHKEAQALAIFMELPRFPTISSQCLLHPATLSLRYLTHINLPDQLYEWVCWVIEKTGLSDEPINTMDPMNSPLPRYDLQTAATIIVTMKLLFGFNDHTEWVLSSKAGDMDKQHPEQKSFNLRRWYRLLQTALSRATHTRKQFTARKQWTHKKAFLRGKGCDSIILKHRRVVEQLQSSFEAVSGRATGPQPSSPSSFIFRWGGEEVKGRSDGPSLHEQSLNCVSAQRRAALKLLNTKYWHADLKDCKTKLKCKSHYKELESSVLPRSYVWLLELFSFLLEVRAATLHEEVKSVERKLFKPPIHAKKSLRYRRWKHWWRTRGHSIKV